MAHEIISKALAQQGYAILQGPHANTPSWQDIHNECLDDFQQAWNNLPADNFLSDGGHYRFRRYSVFNWDDGKLNLLAHEPHYQNTYRNNMNGGIYREFEPFEKSSIENPLLSDIIAFISKHINFSDASTQKKKWRIQAHQFRIVANDEEAGLPTPEGIHRDGADFILIMVLKRHNITGGVNHIYDDAKRLVFGAILEDPGDAVLIDDRKVWHGVSEVYPLDASKPAYRDVLVLTFHHQVNK